MDSGDYNEDMKQLLNVSIEEQVFDVLMKDTHDDIICSESIPVKSAAGHETGAVAKNITVNCIEQPKCVVFVKKLVGLVDKAYGSNCSVAKCDGKVTCKPVMIGSCLKVVRTCSNAHRNESWDSQPMYKGVFAENFQLATSILCSGNSFGKINLMCKFLGLNCISQSTFYRIQRFYVLPSVTNYWLGMQREIIAKDKTDNPDGIVVAVDARMDSPGYSAQHCTVSFGNVETGQILHIEVVDVRETLGKSVNMEKLGFQRGIQFLSNLVPVKEIVTDAHPQIIALMRSNTAPTKISNTRSIYSVSQ